MPKREIDAWLVQSLNIQNTDFLLVAGFEHLYIPQYMG
jgi:hypothetical protein